MDTSTPWFAEICNFIVASQLYKEKIKSDAKNYIWDDPIFGSTTATMSFAVAGGNHHGLTRTARKVLDCGFYWPTIFRDAHQFISTYEQC
ncbi:hypothetical protein CR513_05008, partial [Mucuna pruriens]